MAKREVTANDGKISGVTAFKGLLLLLQQGGWISGGLVAGSLLAPGSAPPSSAWGPFPNGKVQAMLKLFCEQSFQLPSAHCSVTDAEPNGVTLKHKGCMKRSSPKSVH